MSSLYKSDISNDEFLIDRLTYTSVRKEKSDTKDATNITENRDEIHITLVNFDKVVENVSLLNSVLDEYAQIRESFILYKYNPLCTYPPFRLEKVYIGGVHYKRFTLNQFKRFYVDNLENIITQNNVYIGVPDGEDENGFTIVCDRRKLRKEKYDSVLEEFRQFRQN